MSRPPPPFRSETQENTQLAAAGTIGQASRKYQPYLFPNLERVSRAQVLLTRKLEWLLPSSAAAAKVGETIRARMKELFEDEARLLIDYIHVIRPGDLKKYLAAPSFLAVLAPAPHKTRGLLEVELSLSHVAIDMLLGGAGEVVALRPLTDIEEGVLTFVALEGLKALAPNIEPGLPRLRLEGIAHGLDEATRILGEEDQVLVMQFKGVVGVHTGFVRLFIPASVLGIVNPPQSGAERRARRAQEYRHNLARLGGVKTWIRAEIGRAEISNRDLRQLSGGDVVLVDEITARPDKGEGGTARLRVGLGRVARLDAQILVDDGSYKAKITAFHSGEEGRYSRGPTQREDEAAEELSGGRAERMHVSKDQKAEGAELLDDIPLQIAVELARVAVTAEEVVGLKVGQILDLNRVPGEPVELSVNGKLVGRGELVDVEGQIGVRVLSLIG